MYSRYYLVTFMVIKEFVSECQHLLHKFVFDDAVIFNQQYLHCSLTFFVFVLESCIVGLEGQALVNITVIS